MWGSTHICHCYGAKLNWDVTIASEIQFGGLWRNWNDAHFHDVSGTDPVDFGKKSWIETRGKRFCWNLPDAIEIDFATFGHGERE